jgi:VanZ family protein
LICPITKTQKGHGESLYQTTMVNKGANHFWHYWFPILLYCLIIFFQSSYPALETAPDLPFMDKVLHFGGYALLGALFLRGLRHSKFKDHDRLIKIGSILLAGIYGAIDEWHQHYVPYRSADLWDIFFDFAGGLFGVYLYQRLLEKYPKIARV